MVKSAKALAAVLALCGIAIVALGVATDERIICHLGNVVNGYPLSADDFSSGISVAGNVDMREVNFTQLRQFKRICIVEMYTFGEPYSISDGSVRLSGRKACWREAPGMLTVVGVSADGSSRWSQVRVDRHTDFYRVAGDRCADSASAVLRCQNYECSFAKKGAGGGRWALQ